jgi:hypothetical protein
MDPKNSRTCQVSSKYYYSNKHDVINDNKYSPIPSRNTKLGYRLERAESAGVTDGILRVDQLDILLDGALSL